MCYPYLYWVRHLYPYLIHVQICIWLCLDIHISIYVNENSINHQLRRKKEAFYLSQMKMITQETESQKGLRTVLLTRSQRHSHIHFWAKDHASKWHIDILHKAYQGYIVQVSLYGGCSELPWPLTELGENALLLRSCAGGFLGGSVVKNPPAIAGDGGFREDATCCRATKPMDHDYWACALESRSHNHWSPSARQPGCATGGHGSGKPTNRN